MQSIKSGIQPFGMFRISAIFSELDKVKESPSQTAAALEGMFRCAQVAALPQAVFAG